MFSEKYQESLKKLIFKKNYLGRNRIISETYCYFSEYYSDLS